MRQYSEDPKRRIDNKVDARRVPLGVLLATVRHMDIKQEDTRSMFRAGY